MSHPDVSLVNILLSITRVSLVQNKCVFCQLRVHYNVSYNVLTVRDFDKDYNNKYYAIKNRFINFSISVSL